MTTAIQTITKALTRINAVAAGEPLSASDSNDALDTLNDLLDSLSNDEASIFASTESIFTFIPGQYQYTVGNYTGGTFSGALTSGSPTITGVTVPSLLKAGADLSDSQAAIPSGTTVLSFNAIANTVTMSANATSNQAIDVVTYTVPGDFKMERPLRISNSFTRITTSGSSLDYPIEVISQPRYVEIGYKAIPAPWPIAVWYNPTMPLGTLSFYQAPNAAGELHLFTDNILTNIPDLTTDLVLPRGYARFLSWRLAKELAPEYGANWTPNHERNYMEARKFIEALNQQPAVVSKYDSVLTNRQMVDRSWIMNGGFR